MCKLSVRETAELLQKQASVLILTHISPDGDTLGSAFALRRGLEQLGKKAAVVCADTIPEKYAYMARGLADTAFEPQFVAAVDIADEQLFGAELQARYGGKVQLCIDHHRSNTGYADAVYLKETAANCENIYLILKEMGVVFNAEIADCLYTGISTDTGCFRYSNVTPQTHRIAAELLALGAQAAEINRVMFETRTMEYIRLQVKVLQSMELHLNGKCALILLTRKMLEESGCSEEDCDGISSIPRKIEGVLAGVTVREKADGTYKVSLRTHAPLDASEICRKLGGGGHARAAGCTLGGTEYETEKQKLLNIIEAEIKAI